MTKKNSLFNIIFHYLKSFFLSGLFTLLPITLTIALFSFTLKLLKSWLAPIHQLEPDYLQEIPHSEIIVVILFIFIFGFILRVFLLDSLIHLIESLFGKIPLVRQVYFGIKQLVHALSAHDKTSFQQVVLVEFPRPGIYSIGFLTSDHVPHLPEHTKVPYQSVFIPTTPNPTTGYYVMVPASECIATNLSRHEAMTLIISGGIIQPERFQKQ